ncbi:tyrosine-type recombinase/integrase [Variovorax saccharolyticus]|uniref:tyrosine-type recombinase/integrase n=1 Tax=Variovorax saccharolyticus TaxID=3053516 RepID=UPI00257682D1|nr:tyrosine-type recombinase/integrase [Variovorax sp. J31P216]MDM0030369.1 tyrosine-type recombinase/integrase [Variovorax sp. J31P216]
MTTDTRSPLAYLPTSLSLFEDPQGPTQQLAFERWLADEQARGSLRLPSSLAVYRDMWGAFSAWCLGQSPGVTLESLDLRDLQAFQAARFGRKSSDMSLSPRHALRLMRLVDRVLRHHAAQTGEPPNTAASDWLAAHPVVRYAEAAHADPLPDFLSVSEAKHLITFLSDARPRPGLTGSRRDSHAAFTWQELRNRCAVGLQLGGGLTPGDVRALTLASPISRGGRVRDRPWKVSVPGDGNSAARETPIAPWAGELLQHWLQVRAEARIEGDFLFPSTRTGKQWHKESHYKCAKKVLEDAGIDSSEGGSFRLRHTFALRQLRRGFQPETVAAWLGVEPEVMGRYRRVVATPMDVV